MHIGANYQYGTCSFSVWAPYHENVTLTLIRENQHFAMEKAGGAYWTFTAEGLEPGTLYMYNLDGKVIRPDPASNFQPEGVFGPSAVVDHEVFDWKDHGWKGLDIKDLVFYELHVGAFTPEGTFRAALNRIKELRDFGINAVELMPITQFSGSRNWGYDGVFPFSIHNMYGTPDDLKALVNHCHENGIALFVDFVYNHLGPEGNCLNDYGPYFPIDKIGIWGPAVNLDGELSEGVRNYFLENTLHWFNHYHIDGIRLDAVLSMQDNRSTHFLQELNQAVDAHRELTGKKFHLVAESGYNVPSVLTPIEQGGYGFDAQWLDDFQHAIFARITGDREGYYKDYGTVEHLVEILTDSYLYIGDRASYTRRRPDESYRWIPADKFIVFSQNHDQVGNRLLGDRLTTISGFESAKMAAGLVILSPYVPLLFMGEEYGETAPFLFFSDYQGKELADAIIDGRRKEFENFHWAGEVPDPQSVETFEKSKLNWQIRYQEEGKSITAYYHALIGLRKKYSVFQSKIDRQLKCVSSISDDLLFLQKEDVAHEALMVANFSSKPIEYEFNAGSGCYNKILDSADTAWVGPGTSLPEKATNGDKHEIRGCSLAVFLRARQKDGAQIG